MFMRKTWKGEKVYLFCLLVKCMNNVDMLLHQFHLEKKVKKWIYSQSEVLLSKGIKMADKHRQE